MDTSIPPLFSTCQERCCVSPPSVSRVRVANRILEVGLLVVDRFGDSQLPKKRLIATRGCPNDVCALGLRESRRKAACHGVNAATGMAAACTWSMDFGFRASSDSLATANSGYAPLLAPTPHRLSCSRVTPGSAHHSSHLMQCHAGKININVESYVEVVGEDIQRNISDDYGDLSVREALVAKRLYATGKA